MIRANVREPIAGEGDLYSLAACNEIGCRRLVEMMDEFGIDDLDELGEHILEQLARGRARARSRKLPKGTWRHSR